VLGGWAGKAVLGGWAGKAVLGGWAGKAVLGGWAGKAVLGGDPRGQDAVRVVSHVVPNQGVEQVIVGTEMSDGDRDELTVAGCCGLRGGSTQPWALIGGDQGRGDQQHG